MPGKSEVSEKLERQISVAIGAKNGYLAIGRFGEGGYHKVDVFYSDGDELQYPGLPVATCGEDGSCCGSNIGDELRNARARTFISSDIVKKVVEKLPIMEILRNGKVSNLTLIWAGAATFTIRFPPSEMATETLVVAISDIKYPLFWQGLLRACAFGTGVAATGALLVIVGGIGYGCGYFAGRRDVHTKV
jgi:hypothetical protein